MIASPRVLVLVIARGARLVGIAQHPEILAAIDAVAGQRVGVGVLGDMPVAAFIIEIAQDIASDTFLMAAETWGIKGAPDNPVAWLYTVARNKTRDYLRRDKVFREKVSGQVTFLAEGSEEIEIDLSEQNITDSQLQMMFAICHPSIPMEAQIGLCLNILCGFGINEIAAAFLTNKETIITTLARKKNQ